ncbi:hypothetical protein ACL0VS_17830 [Chryseobacterium sp. PMSZPI]
MKTKIILGTEFEEEFFTILDRIIVETPQSVFQQLQRISEKIQYG